MVFADYPICFGTKEFEKHNTICKACPVYKMCAEIRKDKNKTR